MINPGKPIPFSRSLPSSLTAYHDFVRDILTELERLGWPREQLFGVHLALEESISNAVRHGNKHDPTKRVQVDCKVSADRFFARVRDEGCGYDPEQVPDCCATENLEVPGGRGLALMRAYMDRVEFSDEGRCILLEKKR